MDTSKLKLAKQLGVARSTLYYQPKLKKKDELLKQQIIEVWKTFPAYGHKRLALCLKINKKRVQRVMKLFGLKPPRRRRQKPYKPNDVGRPEIRIPNLLLDEYGKPTTITKPDFAWSQDFTYLSFNNKWWYVATVIDLYTREILGLKFSAHHDKSLILEALNQALTTARKPRLLHSDQGSEYKSDDYIQTILRHGILLSYCRKASPW